MSDPEQNAVECEQWVLNELVRMCREELPAFAQSRGIALLPDYSSVTEVQNIWLGRTSDEWASSLVAHGYRVIRVGDLPPHFSNDIHADLASRIGEALSEYRSGRYVLGANMAVISLGFHWWQKRCHEREGIATVTARSEVNSSLPALMPSQPEVNQPPEPPSKPKRVRWDKIRPKMKASAIDFYRKTKEKHSDYSIRKVYELWEKDVKKYKGMDERGKDYPDFATFQTWIKKSQ